MSDLNSMLDSWDELDGVEFEDEEVGFSGGSNRIEGHGVFDVKITMCKLIVQPKKKTQYIEIDFETKEGKAHREQFMIKGSNGLPYYVYQGKKRPHFGLSKVKSLITVLGLYKDETNKMKALFSNTKQAEVEFQEYGKDVKQDYTVFPDVIGSKVKIAVKSKKVNQRSQYDSSDAYMKSCLSATKSFAKANPKKKFAAKAAKVEEGEYAEVYRYFTETEVAHFATADGLLQSEIELGEGGLLDKFLSMNEDGSIYDARTLFVENLSDSERKKLSIDEYGKIEANDSDEEFEDEPEIEDDSSDDTW